MNFSELQKIVGQIKGNDDSIVKIRYKDSVGNVFTDVDVVSIKEEVTHEITEAGTTISRTIIVNAIAPN